MLRLKILYIYSVKIMATVMLHTVSIQLTINNTSGLINHCTNLMCKPTYRLSTVCQDNCNRYMCEENKINVIFLFFIRRMTNIYPFIWLFD